MTINLRFGTMNRDVNLKEVDNLTLDNMLYLLKNQCNRILRRFHHRRSLSMNSTILLEEKLLDIRGKIDLVTLEKSLRG